MKNMQDPRIPPAGDITNSKPRKKRVSTSLQGNDVREIKQVQRPLKTNQKSSKRNLKNEGSLLIQQERSNSDSSGNEYRALRRKYLLLEEENFGLGRELKGVEDEVMTLENEKLELLDQLVVLEGLIDPSEEQQGQLPSL